MTAPVVVRDAVVRDAVDRGAVDLGVVGGGIAGLAAAWAAHRQGWSVRVFESDAEPGGKIGTDVCDGYLCERGPNSFLGSATALWRLIDELGLGGDVVVGRKPAWRFVFRGGRARRLPTDPWTLVFGDWLSWRGKLRLLAEPFAAKAGSATESVAAFASRRLGADAAAGLVAPFVGGVWAGDADVLPAREAFPALWRWEQEAGSLLRGALGARRRARALPAPIDAPRRRGPGLYSLRAGLGSLPRRLVEALPAGAWLGQHRVVAVERVEAAGSRVAAFDIAASTPDGSSTRVAARRLLVAAPAETAATLLSAVPVVAADLASVASCRVAVVHFGGPDPDGRAPRGFGVLTAPGEAVRALGVLFPSSVFPGRAPPGHWLSTAFFGGARDPTAVDLPDADLARLAQAAQEAAFGAGAPLGPLPCTFHHVVRWPAAIPQYTAGHRERMAAATRTLEQAWPGATLAGSHIQGISMADAAQSGFDAFHRLATVGAAAGGFDGP